MGSADESAQLPIIVSTPPRTHQAKWYRPLLIVSALFLVARFGVIPAIVPDAPNIFGHHHKHHGDHHVSQSCQQAEPILPKSFDVGAVVKGQDDRIIEWLGAAVRIPTEIFDVMGEVGEDERWDVFYKFADYLETAFPLVHQHLTKTRVMTHALIFEWAGSEPDLKPLLLTGHQDVVPVLPATRGLWTHDPYGGEYDPKTKRIWGRGSSDDKSGVIGMMSAVELLLETGNFTPTRTVIMALGIDEETGGKVGAYHLGQWLEAKYGPDSMAMLVDEGNGIGEEWGQLWAFPAVAEKGYLDAQITVETTGGHSSVPPDHSGIGYTAELVRALERNPHKPMLHESSPLVAGLFCSANYAPEMPSKLKRSVRKVEKSMTAKSGAKVDTKALKQLEEWYVKGSFEDGTLPRGLGKAMVSTTQAVDIINGGLKINALPEVVTTVVNHRINIASTVQEVQEHIIKTLSPVAEEFNLALEAFGQDVELQGCPVMKKHPNGRIIVSEAFNSSLAAAPVSPYTTESPEWRLLSGTTRGVYATRPNANVSTESGKDIKMSPSMSTGNTDTKRYWNLTRAIYRFAYQLPGDDGLNGNAHTVDESISAKTFIEEVRWFATLIVNVDESREV